VAPSFKSVLSQKLPLRDRLTLLVATQSYFSSAVFAIGVIIYYRRPNDSSTFLRSDGQVQVWKLGSLYTRQINVKRQGTGPKQATMSSINLIVASLVVPPFFVFKYLQELIVFLGNHSNGCDSIIDSLDSRVWSRTQSSTHQAVVDVQRKSLDAAMVPSFACLPTPSLRV
jgi:hypothetical protein